MEISKELFEAVYGKSLKELSLDLSDLKYVDTNAFFFKCKEWAFSEGYQLEISRYWNIPTYYCKIVIRGGDFCEECGESRAIYELEDLREIDIVVKACEWILNEKQLQH